MVSCCVCYDVLFSVFLIIFVSFRGTLCVREIIRVCFLRSFVASTPTRTTSHSFSRFLFLLSSVGDCFFFLSFVSCDDELPAISNSRRKNLRFGFL